MFKTHIPLDWVVALIDGDYTPFDDTEEAEIKEFSKDLGDGSTARFIYPSDKDIEEAEYRIFNGVLTECINIGYNIDTPSTLKI